MVRIPNLRERWGQGLGIPKLREQEVGFRETSKMTKMLQMDDEGYCIADGQALQQSCGGYRAGRTWRCVHEEETVDGVFSCGHPDRDELAKKGHRDAG